MPMIFGNQQVKMNTGHGAVDWLFSFPIFFKTVPYSTSHKFGDLTSSQ
jgi:hypothetical protein